MPASVRPRRIRHLDTLKSVSRALYNMDAAEAEAWEMEGERQFYEARAQMEIERHRAESNYHRKPPSPKFHVAGRAY